MLLETQEKKELFRELFDEIKGEYFPSFVKKHSYICILNSKIKTVC